MNSISISFHPQDQQNAKDYLATLKPGVKPQLYGPQQPALWEYLGVLGGGAALMALFVALALIRNER